MCFSDYEPPEFAETDVAVARKEHRCCECGVVIGRGEKYEVCTGKWNGEFSTFKTCMACVELREAVVRHERSMGCDGGEAIPPFGGLREAVAEMWRG